MTLFIYFFLSLTFYSTHIFINTHTHTPYKKKLVKQLAAERKQKASLLSTTRILTPEDFAAIKKKKLAALANGVLGGTSKRVSQKRGHAETEEEMTERLLEESGAMSVGGGIGNNLPTDFVDPSNLEAQIKRKRMDKAERMASIMSGREDRLKYGSRKGKHNNESSKTNREKNKFKNAMMILHGRGVRSKIKRSFKEKQQAHYSEVEKRRKAK